MAQTKTTIKIDSYYGFSTDQAAVTRVTKEELQKLLKGSHICVTGKIPGYTRAAAEELLRELEPTVKFTTSVTGKTDLLIAGNGAGQKLFNGRNRGITILSAHTVTAVLTGASDASLETFLDDGFTYEEATSAYEFLQETM